MSFHRVFAVGTLVLLSCCAVFMTGCNSEEGIHQVRVPAELSERRGAANPTLPGPPANAGGLQYKTPAGWAVKPNGPMRLASLDVVAGDQKCDVSITKLGPGQPILENVNRWRGQVKLPPLKEDELELQPVRCGDAKGSLVQAVGETETILAVLVPQADATWFVKLQGPNAMAKSQLEKLVAFTESIKLP